MEGHGLLFFSFSVGDRLFLERCPCFNTVLLMNYDRKWVFVLVKLRL